MSNEAETEHPVHELFRQRWSPRALDPAATVSRTQLLTLLDAARWAPSYGNTQPARYLVGLRGDPTFERIFGTLNTGNQSWAHRSAALLVGLVVTKNDKGDLPYAEYGLGLATENLVLQAVAEGLVAHQMAGFDPYAVTAAFALPEEVVPVVAVAVGVLGDPELLGEDWRVEREKAPRKRLPLGEIALSGWTESF